MLLPWLVWAHDGIDEQIHRVTRLIRQSPQDADLYFRRAELERAAHLWKPALADYDSALRLRPGYRAALLGAGLTRLSAGDLTAARDTFDRFLALVPGHPGALLGRARCFNRLGDPDAAVRDYSAAIHHTHQPQPEQFLERFETLVQAGRKEEALASLAEGERTLGVLVTFTLPAVDVAVELKRHQEAAARLTHFVDTSVRKETWLARRADVYERAGRNAEARADREAAILAIESLPSWRQSDNATARLRKQLMEKLQ